MSTSPETSSTTPLVRTSDSVACALLPAEGRFDLEGQWDLSEFGITDVSLEIAKIGESVERFEVFAGTINDQIPVSQFCAVLDLYDDLKGALGRLSKYGSLASMLELNNQELSTQAKNIDKEVARFEGRLFFFEEEFQKVCQESALRLIEQSGSHGYFLSKVRARAPHTLSDSVEGDLREKAIETKILVKSRAEICSAMKFEFHGETLTEPSLKSKFQHPDSAVRHEAYAIHLNAYESSKAQLSPIYLEVFRRHDEEMALRGYKTPDQRRNFENGVPDDAVESVIRCCVDNAEVFRRYFAVKAQKLGDLSLHRADLLAPLPDRARIFSYEDGSRIVCAAFHDFSPEFGEIASRLRLAGHVDSQSRPNKRGGACCEHAGKVMPYILENCRREMSVGDLFTQAHEFGHAIAFVIAQQEQKNLTYYPGLPLSETASTFSERILMNYLMKRFPESAESLLIDQFSKLYSAVMRQATFAQFEKKAHTMVRAGAGTEDISDLYIRGLRDQLGNQITVPDSFRYEWLTVPHFLDPFYVPTYPFGHILSLSLYERYMQEGSSFVPKLREFYAAGGSVDPRRNCAQFGFDIADPAHWQQGFNLLQRQIGILENGL